MKIRILPLILLSGLFAITSFTYSYSKEFVVSLVQGTDAEILKLGDVNWTKAAIGQILDSGDQIRTTESKVVLISQDGHKILVQQKSHLDFILVGPTEWEFLQGDGKVSYKVKKLSSNQSMKIKTPNAVCSVRGTGFTVTVNPDHTNFAVHNGAVYIQGMDLSKPGITVTKSMESNVSGNQSPSQATKMSSDQIRKESQSQNLLSTTNLPPTSQIQTQQKPQVQSQPGTTPTPGATNSDLNGKNLATSASPSIPSSTNTGQ